MFKLEADYMSVKCVALIFLAVTLQNAAMASEAKGSLASFAFGGVGEKTLFVFRLSGEIKGKPSCNTSGKYAVHMNVRNMAFAASLIVNTRKSKQWEKMPSVWVAGKDACTNVPDAEDLNRILIYEGDSPVAGFEPGFPIRYYNPLIPVDADHPLLPVIASLQPTRSPVLESRVEQFERDYCALKIEETAKKWDTSRSQLPMALELPLKTPFVGYVGNGSLKSICIAGKLAGASLFDERSRRTYVERIAGRSAIAIWRTGKPDLFHGIGLYLEAGEWKMDFRYNGYDGGAI
jgi:hypothetical protein